MVVCEPDCGNESLMMEGERRGAAVAQDTGFFNKKSEARSAQEQMMSNPDFMTNMMKQNLSGIVPQVPHPLPLLLLSLPLPLLSLLLLLALLLLLPKSVSLLLFPLLL